MIGLSKAPPIRHFRARTVAAVALGLWVALALALVVSTRWTARRDHYDWTSSHAGVMARNFARIGFVSLRGLPVQNNPAFGRTLDVYTHFPPLFYLILSKVGSVEASGRALMLGAHLATCLCLAWVSTRAWGWFAGALAALTFLAAPVSLRFANLVYWPYFNLALVALSVVAFVEAVKGGRPSWRGWAACLVLAVLSMSTSWELFFVHAGFVVLGVFRREKGIARLAFALASVDLLVAGAWLGHYAWSCPELFEDLYQTFLHRTGLSVDYEAPKPNVYSFAHLVSYSVETSDYVARGVANERLLLRFRKLLAFYQQQAEGVGMVGAIALLSTTILAVVPRAARKSRPLAYGFGGFLALWVGWYAAFSQQAAHHAFMAYLITPSAALAVGFAGAWASRRLVRLRKPRLAAIGLAILGFAVPLMLLEPVVRNFVNVVGKSEVIPIEGEDLGAVASKINRLVPPGSVVLTPRLDMQMVYYTDHLTIRGVCDDGLFEYALTKLDTEFPGRDVYLAAPAIVWMGGKKQLRDTPADLTPVSPIQLETFEKSGVLVEVFRDPTLTLYRIRKPRLTPP